MYYLCGMGTFSTVPLRTADGGSIYIYLQQDFRRIKSTRKRIRCMVLDHAIPHCAVVLMPVCRHTPHFWSTYSLVHSFFHDRWFAEQQLRADGQRS